MTMKKTYYRRRSFERYDDRHIMMYLNEEIVPDYVPEESEEESAVAPQTAYCYEGMEKDGGTLVECAGTDRDSLINAIIRSKYSQSEEDAVKTHQIIKLTENLDSERLTEYTSEWNEFNERRDMAKRTVDGWLNG